jgi:hypothetical protein
MDNAICYLNTDLDLKSGHDLRGLAAAFDSHGIHPLHVTYGEDAKWHASFETAEHHDQPEANIAAMLAAIEALTEDMRTVWRECLLREFNLGYDCGAKPWAFNQGLSSQLLGRMAAAGASLRITLYPPDCEMGAARRTGPS